MKKTPHKDLDQTSAISELRGVASQPIQIQSLQAGRALAALAVVVHHATLAAKDFAGTVPISAFLQTGYLGVDFFFVLSGFIIYHSSQGKSLSQYTKARVRRVYLPYLPVGIGVGLLYLWLPQFSAGNRGWSWLATITLLPINSSTALSVAWTLKHEIFFYLIFAFLHFSRTLEIGLSAWTVLICGATLVGVGKNVPLALINLEFIFGIGVAFAYRRGWGRPEWYLAALPPLGLWLWLGADRENSVLVGLAFAALILPTARLEGQGHFRVPGWLLRLGAASYAIYLVHGLAISATSRLAAGQHWGVVLLLGIIAGTSAGLVYYVLVERRLIKWASGIGS